MSHCAIDLGLFKHSCIGFGRIFPLVAKQFGRINTEKFLFGERRI